MAIPNNEWVGEEQILEYYETAKSIDAHWETGGVALTFCVLFVTGARVSEALALKVEHVRYDDKWITIDKLPVLKQKKGKTAMRTFIIPRYDILAEEFITYLNDAEREGRVYLIGGFTGKFSSESDMEKPATRSLVYKRISMISKNLWPHRVRDLRALHLAGKRKDGGYHFDVYAMKDWFGWKSVEMPAYYVGSGGVEKQRRAFEPES